MYGMSIRMSDKAVRDVLERTRRNLNEEHVKAVIGRAGVNKLRAHLMDYDRDNPNALGAKRTHFYAAAARATNFQSVAGGVALNINHVGIAQRYFGGRIEPVNAELLAIPNVREAHGTRPGEYNFLQLVMFGDTGVGALIERSHSVIETRGGRDSSGRFVSGTTTRTVTGANRNIWFWLVPEVEQDPDPDVLPTGNDLVDAILPELQSYVQRINRRR